MQVCKFTSLQIYKIKNSKNYKLIITNCNSSMQVYKLKNSKNYKLIIAICNFASMQVYKFAHLQN
jgi:hypothetical protein